MARSGTGPDSLHWRGRLVADLDPPLVAGPHRPPAGSFEAGRRATLVLGTALPRTPFGRVPVPTPRRASASLPSVPVPTPVLWRLPWRAASTKTAPRPRRRCRLPSPPNPATATTTPCPSATATPVASISACAVTGPPHRL